MLLPKEYKSKTHTNILLSFHQILWKLFNSHKSTNNNSKKWKIWRNGNWLIKSIVQKETRQYNKLERINHLFTCNILLVPALCHNLMKHNVLCHWVDMYIIWNRYFSIISSNHKNTPNKLIKMELFFLVFHQNYNIKLHSYGGIWKI